MKCAYKIFSAGFAPVKFSGRLRLSLLGVGSAVASPPDVRVGKDEIRLKICRSQELTAGANKCADKKSVKLAPLPFKDLMAVFLHLR